MARSGPPGCFEPSIRTWLGYNASYVIALAILGVVPVAAFEPRTTMAELFVLVTCSVLVTLLGLDVSIIGLVRIPTGSLYLVLELAGLIVVWPGRSLGVVIALARDELGARSVVPDRRQGDWSEAGHR